jgi:hypothetical protein
MTLSIVGAGFGRTGTYSLKAALEQIGFAPCYHMEDVKNNTEHPEIWRAALRNKPVDWHALLDGYRAAVDWPASFFWRELLEVYPDAKVLLSVRDPDKWYTSMSNTIFELLKAEGARDNLKRSMTHELIFDHVFPGDVDNKDYVLGVFRSHIETVRQSVSTPRLLAYEVKEGWAPLCKFLGIDVPKQEFPHRNTTQEFRKATKMKPH